MSQKQIIRKIVLDFVILVCVALPLLLLVLLAEPYHRGYFENDLSIRLPYKEQTITEFMLLLIAFAIMLIVIVTTEVIRDKNGKSVSDKYICGALTPGWLWESYLTVGVFLFGAASQQLFSNVTKYVIGRLRPNFYDVCRPIPTASELNQFGYIQDFNCTGTDQYLLKAIRLSFPSAHSSFAMYTAVFLIMYLQVKTKWRGSKLLRHAVQYALGLAAWYVGLSRVTDHMHHWSDVAVGFIVGAVIAVLTFVYILKPKKYGIPNESWTDPRQPGMLPRPVLSR